MAEQEKRPDVSEKNEEYGAGGHETGAKDASAMGTAGIYAAPVNEDADEEVLNKE